MLKHSFHKSIKYRIWFSFFSILVFVLGLMYILQVISFPIYFQYEKTRDILSASQTIKENWDSQNIGETISNLAKNKKLFIQIIPTSNPLVTLKYNELGEMPQDFTVNDLFSINDLKEINARINKTPEKHILLPYYYEKANQKYLLYATTITTGDQVQAYLFIYNAIQPTDITTQILEKQFFVVTAIVLILSMAISVFTSAHISKPIIKISQAARGLPNGKFDNTVFKNEYSEIKQLANTLHAASKEIEKSESVRKELLANISHDLRTPLTMIKAYAEMIRDISGDNPEKRAKHVDVIIDETNRLASLVTDILDLSRLESGTENFVPSCIDFSLELTEILSRFEILTERDSYDFNIELENNLYIYADTTKLGQVIYNLINNAITYTGEDKKIMIRLYSESGFARFEVEDTGEGIPEDLIPYIWERYYKVNRRGDTHRRGKVGTGLGLSIVKNVLELHHFRYGVNSKVGQGSVFWFEAPLAEGYLDDFSTE